MATIKQYTTNLWRVQKVVMRKLGLAVAWSGSEEKIRALGSDVLLATLLKILVDKGVMTDGELNAAYLAVANADFPVIKDQAFPALGEGEPADPDLGV